MLRNYLVNIHKFYYKYHRGSMDSFVMPVIVFTLTLTSLLGSIDMIFNDSYCIEWLKSIHDTMVVVPGLFLIFVFSLWYRQYLPSNRELSNISGMWPALLGSLASVLLFLFASIFFH